MLINLLLFSVVWKMKKSLTQDGGGLGKGISSPLLEEDDFTRGDSYEDDIIPRGNRENSRNLSMASVSSITSLHENIEKVRSISVA